MTLYTVRVIGSDSSFGQGYTLCTTSPCLYVHQDVHVANMYNIFVTTINQYEYSGSLNSARFGELKCKITVVRKYLFKYDLSISS